MKTSWTFVYACCLLGVAAWAGYAAPWQTSSERQNGLNNGRVIIEFTAEDSSSEGQEIFPTFAFDPMVGDHVRGRSGQWYVVRRRAFDRVNDADWNSESRFTIRLEKIEK
jgi:hypothetical protein